MHTVGLYQLYYDGLDLFKNNPRPSLVAEWIRVFLPMQGPGFDLWSRKIPPAAEQPSPCTTTTELVLSSPCATTAEAPVSRTCALRQEKPPQ